MSWNTPTEAMVILMGIIKGHQHRPGLDLRMGFPEWRNMAPPVVLTKPATKSSHHPETEDWFMKKPFRLLQLADSTFPVGAFSFSNGLETAAHLGYVHDAATLKSYVETAAKQAAFTDAVCGLIAFRAAQNGGLAGIMEADNVLLRFRMNEEARLMLTRMGKKFAELGVTLFGNDSLLGKWLEEIKKGSTPGCYPVALAIGFALEGMEELDYFAAHQYGAINMILAAALRCVRVSHYDTQKILYEIGEKIPAVYEETRKMGFENMNAFAPQMDIFASLHEKGQMRMFMN